MSAYRRGFKLYFSKGTIHKITSVKTGIVQDRTIEQTILEYNIRENGMVQMGSGEINLLERTIFDFRLYGPLEIGLILIQSDGLLLIQPCFVRD